MGENGIFMCVCVRVCVSRRMLSQSTTKTMCVCLCKIEKSIWQTSSLTIISHSTRSAYVKWEHIKHGIRTYLLHCTIHVLTMTLRLSLSTKKVTKHKNIHMVLWKKERELKEKLKKNNNPVCECVCGHVYLQNDMRLLWHIPTDTFYLYSHILYFYACFFVVVGWLEKNYTHSKLVHQGNEIHYEKNAINSIMKKNTTFAHTKINNYFFYLSYCCNIFYLNESSFIFVKFLLFLRISFYECFQFQRWSQIYGIRMNVIIGGDSRFSWIAQLHVQTSWIVLFRLSLINFQFDLDFFAHNYFIFNFIIIGIDFVSFVLIVNIIF